MMKNVGLSAATAVAAAVSAAGGLTACTAGPEFSTSAARLGAVAAADGNEKCSETARRFENNGYVYLYTRDWCEGLHDGSHDEKDKDNDKDYAVGGDIEDFDNDVTSLINKGYHNIKFYNYPNYNENHPEGDSFCVAPGHWVNKLYLYGDGHYSWHNSISSHRWISDSEADQECKRWFG